MQAVSLSQRCGQIDMASRSRTNCYHNIGGLQSCFPMKSRVNCRNIVLGTSKSILSLGSNHLVVTCTHYLIMSWKCCMSTLMKCSRQVKLGLVKVLLKHQCSLYRRRMVEACE